MEKRLVVVGGGFAGVWAALGAARRLAEEGGEGKVPVTLVSRDGFLGIRPRFYETDLDATRVPLDRLLDPAGVRFVPGAVRGVDARARAVEVETPGGARRLSYDALVLAAGSRLRLPDNLPGLEHALSVDTYDEAQALARRLDALGAERRAEEGRFAAVVVGAGFTGLETATELATRLRDAARRAGADPSRARVVLVERGPEVAPGFGWNARRVIRGALGDLGVEAVTNAAVSGIDARGVTLADGRRLAGQTVVWTGGTRASRLAASLPVGRDGLGRVPVDAEMRVLGLRGIYAAGDMARATTDGKHDAAQSCQHAMPQGRYAGFNAAGALLGRPARPYEQRLYVTCLDLGEWGALLTEGWGRDRVLTTGREAKELKRYINRSAIYPPLEGDRAALLKAAAPEPGGRAYAWVQRRVLGNGPLRRMVTGRAADGPRSLREGGPGLSGPETRPREPAP